MTKNISDNNLTLIDYLKILLPHKDYVETTLFLEKSPKYNPPDRKETILFKRYENIFKAIDSFKWEDTPQGYLFWKTYYFQQINRIVFENRPKLNNGKNENS